MKEERRPKGRTQLETKAGPRPLPRSSIMLYTPKTVPRLRVCTFVPKHRSERGSVAEKFVEIVDLGDDNTKYLSYISLTVLSFEGERAWDCLAAKDAVILRYGLTKKCWLVWWLQSFMNMTTSRKDHANMSRDYMGVVLNKGSQELFSSVCRPTRVMFFLLIRDSDDSLVFATLWQHDMYIPIYN